MKIIRSNWLVKKYIYLATRFADGLFDLILMCGGLAFYLFLLFIILMFALGPLGLLMERFSFLAKSTWGVVICVVLVALLWGICILLFNYLLGPVINRLLERFNSLSKIIDDWQTQGNKTMDKKIEQEINDVIAFQTRGVPHRLLMNEIKNAFLEYVENGNNGNPLLISKYNLSSLNDAIATYSGMAGQAWYIRMIKRAEELKMEIDRKWQLKEKIGFSVGGVVLGIIGTLVTSAIIKYCFK